MFLATGSAGGKICRWDLREQNEVPVDILSGHGSVCSVRFSPDSKWITAGCQDGSIQMLDVVGNVTQLSRVHIGPVLSHNFRPDGGFLATSSSDGRICVWDITNKSKKWSRDLGAPIWSVSFSPNENSWLAVRSIVLSVCGASTETNYVNI
jgi:WD40 repeat protein